MQTKTIDIAETQTNLKELLSLVREGTEIILSEGETQVAKIIAISPPKTPLRQPGLHPGSILTTEDFDEPLPEEFWMGK